LQQSSNRLVDEPDVGVALEWPGLSGVTVDLRRLFG
jgi:hypothetical protein